MALSYKFALVCEDIRREHNGKLMIIGLYTPNIVVRKLPADLKLAFFLGFEADAPGKYSLKIKLTHLETGAANVQAEGGLEISEAGFAAMPVAMPVPVKFNNSGAYAISVEIDGVEQPAHTFLVLEAPKQPPTN